ncbi:hypothetical protein E2320_011673 [Naja naja]|nr:hypothetical protein E2320_011673 [Naja naja]
MEVKRLDDEIARKASMREEETAATIRDVEVRQMELETQRRLFEQNLVKEQEAMTQEVKGEMDTSRRKADLEERLFQRLIEAEQGGNRKTHEVLEECLAKAHQENIDVSWQMEFLHKRICDDMDRDQRYQEVAELLHKTRMAEVKLLEAMKAELTEKMEETAGKKEQLMAQQNIAAASDANRKRFLNQEMNDAIELASKLQEGDGYFVNFSVSARVCPEQK